MSLKKLIPSLAAVAVASAFVAPAQAAYAILDGWKLTTPVAAVSNIGRLNVVSGTATVEQQVNGSGNPFIGATFSETGLIYSLSYTKENVTGAGDSGAPNPLGDFLTISFSNVMGMVDSISGSGSYHYTFTSGTYSIAGLGGNYAGGSIVGIGGTIASTTIIGGANGDSTLLSTILGSVPGFDVTAGVTQYGITAGQSLLGSPGLASGDVLFQTVTNNNVTSVLGTGACSFDITKTCLSASVASAGDIYVIAKVVPEPGALALVGVALAGLGAFSRRAGKKA